MGRNKGAKRAGESRAQKAAVEAAAAVTGEPLELTMLEQGDAPNAQAGGGLGAASTQPYEVFLATFPPKGQPPLPMSWEDVRAEFPEMKKSDTRFFEEKGIPPELVAATLARGTRPRFDLEAWEIHVDKLSVAELRRATRLYGRVHDAQMPIEEWLAWVNVDPKLLYFAENIRLLCPDYRVRLREKINVPPAESVWLAYSLHPEFLSQAFGGLEWRVMAGVNGHKRVANALSDAKFFGMHSSYQDVFDFYHTAKGILGDEEFATAFAEQSQKWPDLSLYRTTTLAWKDYGVPPAEALSWSWELYKGSSQFGTARGGGIGQNPERLHGWDELTQLNKNLCDLSNALAPPEKNSAQAMMGKVGEFVSRYEHTSIPVFTPHSGLYGSIYAAGGGERLDAWAEYFSARGIDGNSDTAVNICSRWKDVTPSVYSAWKGFGFESQPTALESFGFSLDNPQKFQKFLDTLGPKNSVAGPHVLDALSQVGGDKNTLRFYYRHSAPLREKMSPKNLYFHYTLQIRLNAWARHPRGKQIFRALGGDVILWAHPEYAERILKCLGGNYYKKLSSKGYSPQDIKDSIDVALALPTAYEWENRAAVVPEPELKKYGKALQHLFDSIQLQPETDSLSDIGQVYIRYRKSRQGKAGGDAAKAVAVLWEYLRELPRYERNTAIKATTGWYMRAFTPEQIVRWWRAGWPVANYKQARQAVKNHPRNYTIEEVVSSAALMYGFSRQGR